MQSDELLEQIDEPVVEEPKVIPPQKEEPKEPEIKENIVVEDITPQTNTPRMHDNVELPPKSKIELEVHDLPSEMTEGTCNCGSDEACPKCIDSKGL
jgi:hypothetical protein